MELCEEIFVHTHIDSSCGFTHTHTHTHTELHTNVHRLTHSHIHTFTHSHIHTFTHSSHIYTLYTLTETLATFTHTFTQSHIREQQSTPSHTRATDSSSCELTKLLEDLEKPVV